MPKLSVILPMYNEVNIQSNLKEVLASLKKNFDDYEVVLVDDGSTNNCLIEAQQVKSKHLRILSYDENKGKGHALKYGFKFATGDYITFIDADLDLHPDQIKSFYPHLKKYDIVIGNKRHSESKVHYPWYRKFLSFGYHKLILLLLGLKFKDTQSGLKLFRKEALDIILPKVTVKKYAFDLELLVSATAQHMRIYEAPIILDYKFDGTGINFKQIWYIFLDTLAVCYRKYIRRYYK